jgi:hypothetical protein
MSVAMGRMAGTEVLETIRKPSPAKSNCPHLADRDEEQSPIVCGGLLIVHGQRDPAWPQRLPGEFTAGLCFRA